MKKLKELQRRLEVVEGKPRPKPAPDPEYEMQVRAAESLPPEYLTALKGVVADRTEGPHGLLTELESAAVAEYDAALERQRKQAGLPPLATGGRPEGNPKAG